MKFILILLKTTSHQNFYYLKPKNKLTYNNKNYNKMQNNQQIRGYRILRKIGSGATSRVYEASKDGQDCALKVAKKAGNQFMNEFNYSTQVPEAVAVQPQEMFNENIDN